VNEQQPWQILNPRDALIEAAKLNRESIEQMHEFGEINSQGVLLANSLSTYALAMYRRES
jgi:hypothetical protein